MGVTASEDKTTKIWGVKSGNCVTTLIGHESAVYCAAFSPSFVDIVTASADCTARIWSFEGECKHTLSGHTAGVFSCLFGDGGRSVVTFAQDSVQKEWSVKSGKCGKSSKHSAVQRSVYIASYSPDSKHYVIAPEKNIAHICVAGTGECVFRLVGHRACIISASFAVAWAAFAA